MAFDNPAKDKILQLVKAYEQIASENYAMKIMFETAQIGGRKGIPGWRSTLQEILARPENQKATHEAFAPLYAEIESAIDQAAMLSVLLKVPTKMGRPN
jgi:hypothetical protein